MREFAALNLFSLSRPVTVLLYGMLPKFVCRLVPALVLRQVLVRSIKPTGVIQASPIFNCNGEEEDCSAAGAGTALRCGTATAGNGVTGITGVVDATWPIPLNALEEPSAFSSSACCLSSVCCIV